MPTAQGHLPFTVGTKTPGDKSLPQLRSGGSFHSLGLTKLPVGCLSSWDSPWLIPSFGLWHPVASHR